MNKQELELKIAMLESEFTSGKCSGWVEDLIASELTRLYRQRGDYINYWIEEII